MSLNETPSSERIHIGFFGMRNAGKSSVVNAVTGQKLALVSDVKGTTTDPVQKAMELLPLGPVVIIDTPGIDDEGELGAMRVERAKNALAKVDIALLVVDGAVGLRTPDETLITEFKSRKIPYIVVFNKSDLLEKSDTEQTEGADSHEQSIYVSAENGQNIHELKEKIAHLGKTVHNEKKLVGDLIDQGDTVILVTPIDESAPKGRLILPQQQMIRDILDHGGINIVVQVDQLESALKNCAVKPRMVITDSQAFKEVSRIVPEDIPLTSFSILFARYKGELSAFVNGADALDKLQDGDKVLLSEGCTHHRQCNDIGTVKLPAWIRKYTGKELEFAWSSGTEFPSDLSAYTLVIHCGGCMLNEREIHSRIDRAVAEGVPITNYGTCIAKMNGILDRSLQVLH
ncbi:[FeFe] hydrogenase H-cluster maturation GTPase HydF [Lachnospiraceae bacterium]|nr:[FeFe] hydrogenase H-cluster maturation GTPase HydF [Lachnospiraceae bacterium]